MLQIAMDNYFEFRGFVVKLWKQEPTNLVGDSLFLADGILDPKHSEHPNNSIYPTVRFVHFLSNLLIDT